MEFVVIIVLLILAFIVKAIYDKKNNRIKLIQKLKREWGQIPEEEYTPEELKSLTSYYRSIKDELHDVDDITWNDIDMDQVFMLINNTSSAIGEEYLYSILRKLQYDEKELLERNRLIEFFQNNPEKRLELQIALKSMGKLRNVSVHEYINRLDFLGAESSLSHYIMAGGLIFSILLIPFNPAIGGLLTFIMVANNIFKYYKRKGQIEAYFSVCSYLIRLLNCIKEVTKLNIDEIKPYTDQLEKASKAFAGFKKGSRVVAGKNPNGDMADIILDYERMLFHSDLIKFNSMLISFKKNRELLNEMFVSIGKLDSMISIASFRTMLDYYCIPELSRAAKPFLKVEELYHPMIEEPITNSIAEDRCVLITGSNASGKSTFIKTLAINAILSQTIYTSLCKSYKASFFQVASSMALQDNIFSKESYYIVEIKSLKRILDRLNDQNPILCFVDEVLRGTNTLERIAASSQILYSFSKGNALCFAATHDIELTHILEKYYSNYHFQEQIVDNNILFDYKLFSGRAISRNAIKLLGVMGYSDDIIESATNSANQFLEKGTWSILE
ncbi:MAG: mismatch repair protein MutS domain protein [Anaerocolumna sp.]|jgi:DNA mismatch repair ATPase MutS|nr:mismatch repair protein MutS domain protein [Anaerocolumna sp.]